MSSNTSVLSQTLRAITLTKINELQKQRAAFEQRKQKALSPCSEQADVRARLTSLIKDLKEFPGVTGNTLEYDLDHAQKWLQQSLYDPSIPEERLLKLESQLISHLDNNGRKLELAHLYSRLLTEWIEVPAGPVEPEADQVEVGSDDDFEVLQNSQNERLQQLRDKFAKVVFEPLDTDEVEIDDYLRQLFPGDEGEETLKSMREDVESHGERMLKDHFRLDDQSLKWCIKALLKNELLNDEKKASLKEFLKDEAVLAEIRDVLNMRFRDIETWDWNLGDAGMPVQPRQSLNGKWRVMMDEDVLQALLTHWIGTSWAVYFKGFLRGFSRRTSLLKRGTRLSDNDRSKLRYYFSNFRGWDLPSVNDTRREIYEQDFFMAPLPSKMFEDAGGYDDDDGPEKDPDKKSPKEVKQLLLRTMATEVTVRRSLDGEVAVVQSDFQWFATGIAHSTIFAVMRFLGFPEQWITFFKKALSPPMDMLDGGPARRRARGLPMAHVFEKWLGEMVMFFLDLAVAQNAEMLLYRFHDDLWLAGEPAKCAKAWQTMESFAKVMGLQFNQSKTGSVYLTDGKLTKNRSIEKTLPSGPVMMNFLLLDPQCGNWIINQEHVDQHVRQLQKQLDGSSSVLQWIKTWNSCIGRFFSYTFGEPAHCFGRDHLDKTLESHRNMQRHMFNSSETGKNVAEHLKLKIAKNLNCSPEDIPDSWLFMPESFGGLELKNPFPPLLLLRDDICEDPEALMKQYHEEELRNYNIAKKFFDEQTDKERRKRYKQVFDDDITATLSWQDAQSFISFEEYTKHREAISPFLKDAYVYLLGQPKTTTVMKTQRLATSLQRGLMGEDKDEDEAVWWVLQYFEEELWEKFGGPEVVDRSLLPLGVLKALKERRVTWQMVL